MVNNPQGTVCLKWTYGDNFFHEHIGFIGLAHGSGSAQIGAELLIDRAKNAVEAIDNGSMIDYETTSDLEELVTPEIQVELEALDEVRIAQDVDRFMRQAGLEIPEKNEEK